MISWSTQEIKGADESPSILGLKGMYVMYCLFAIGGAFLFGIIGSFLFSPAYSMVVMAVVCGATLYYLMDKYRKYGQYGLDKQRRNMQLPKGISNSVKIRSFITIKED